MTKAKASKTVKIKGANAADKQNIALAKRANAADRQAAKSDARAPDTIAAPKTQTLKRGDQAPEAKATPAAKTKAADKLFKDADAAAAAGLPPDITVEQNDKRLQRAVLGY